MKKNALFLVAGFLFSIIFFNILVIAENEKSDSWTYDGITYKLPVPREDVLIPPDLPKVYIVKEKDTLWDLSGAYLKNPFFWPIIWEVNPKVENPHRIYPGDQLFFPGPTVAQKQIQKDKPAIAEKKPDIKENKLTHEIKIVKKETLKEPEEKEQFYSTYNIYDTIYSSGFITEKKSGKDVVPLGKIISAPFDNGTITAKSRVYTDIVNCQIDSVFKIYRIDEKIKHPKTKKVLGRMVKTLGYMQIVCKNSSYSEGLVIKAYDEIQIGDKLMKCDQTPVKFNKEPEWDQCFKTGSSLKGTIIRAANNFQIFSDLDIVYLDLGSTNGIKPGDYFAVVLKTGNKKISIYKQIAQLVILKTKANTSSAVITKSIKELCSGDMIELL